MSWWDRLAQLGQAGQQQQSQGYGSGYGYQPQQYGVGAYAQQAHMGNPYGGNTMGQDMMNGGNGIGDSTQAAQIQANSINQQNQFGMNLNTAQMGIKGLSGLGNLYMGYQNHQLARDSYETNKQLGLANLANQTAAYNQNLEDYSASRFNTGGGDAAKQAYMEKYGAQKIK